VRKEPFIYLILTLPDGNPPAALAMARAAISGGITWLQMRIKGKRRRDLLPLGRALHALCRAHGVTFIVNDDPILARRLRADGVHLGQEDMANFPIPFVRRLLGKGKLIGVSTHSLSQAKAALSQDVDYIAFGPLFPTPAKPYSIGTQEIPLVLSLTEKPIILIGGIDVSNIGMLKDMGGKYFAMIRGLLDAPDITARVKEIRARLGL